MVETKENVPGSLAAAADTITQQPQQQQDMSLNSSYEKGNSGSSGDDDTSSIPTLSEAASGYHRNNSECTEFCLEFCSCFGLCEGCCPSDGEGCVTWLSAFCGNVCLALCHC
ncbi:uncharacterized protein PRCAT00006262001 [Priceomyces carsonii]|uniref:uncharacterized protein n=1 Tax=Priceomyces carsonii TaxID=28549 RepID=UPI002ED8DD96|nr:unnamed protein product [Priceomyces carsonii]